LAELKALQADRKAAIEKAEHEARLLVQLAEAEEAEGRNYDPSMDFPPESRPLGFVFSRSEISASSNANSASAKPVASSMANVGRAILPSRLSRRLSVLARRPMLLDSLSPRF
jgi:hypothetical protein